jgi:uncharacterized protein with FMN-binding domain
VAANATPEPAGPPATTVTDTSGTPSAPPVARAEDVPAADAPAPAAAVAPVPAAPRLGPYKDGTYFGWGTSRHGDLQVAVAIRNGGIASAEIAQCLTRYSCDVIAHLPGQVAKRQTPDVDVVGGATVSSDAYYWAVVEALKQAK